MVQILAYSLHLLQSLDIGYFLLFKSIYKGFVQKRAITDVTHIDKDDFLEIYLTIRQLALSIANIKAGFTGTGLHPIDPGRVLCKLQNKTQYNQIATELALTQLLDK
jgi:hypothetical protein